MTRNETFSGRREFPIAGHYFELLSTVSAVDLEFFDSAGRMIANELQIEEGYFVDRRGVGPFARFAVITGASEAVKFLVTDGFSGQRSALSDVTDRAARLLGIVYGTLGQLAQELLNGVNALVVVCKGTLGTLTQIAIGGVNALQVSERGHSYGVAFSSVTAFAGAGTELVFAAAANTGGAWIHAASIDSGSGSNTQIGLIANPTAPTTGVDGTVILAALNYISTGAGETRSAHVELVRPVFLPSGSGLWFRNSIANAEGACYRRVLYTLL